MIKITKKNSFYFNQLWLDKAIKEGNLKFLPTKQIPGLSIGEYIEAQYENLDEEQKKVTVENSILYTTEWVDKFYEENIPFYRYPSRCKKSLGQDLSLRYYQLELIKRINESNQKQLIYKTK